MQIFYINKDSELPSLRVELINDGRYDFMKSSQFNNAIQNADITFSMWDENDVLKVSNAPCGVVLRGEDTCVDNYIIEYKWNKRDTKKKGQYKGQFKITFKDDLKEEGVIYDGGDLIMPIYEDLIIMVK